MEYDLFNELLNSVCNHFIEDFYIYVYWGNWFLVFFFFVVSLSVFGIRVVLTL
jgi:hypothetical protein